LDQWEFETADFREDWYPQTFDDIGAHEGLLEPETYYHDRHFDLSLCIEVAEHLPPDRADYLVRLLATCSDTVFFSAAHPGQGGTLHLNEQPPEYWLERFRSYGFDLHPDNARLRALISANPHCQRVKWLIPNAMLLTRNQDATAQPA